MIVIAGKNNIAVNALSYLSKFIQLQRIAVVCNECDDGKDSWQLSLRKKALEINVVEISLSEAERVAEFFISLEFDKIINISNFQTKEIFNIHFSLLPKYRGVYTSSLPILNNELETGVTLHKIDSGIDSGCIISQKKIKIKESDCALDLYMKYTCNALILFENQINEILNGNYHCKKQDIKKHSYYSRKSISFTNNEINFDKDSVSIIRFIRAFAFRPFQLASFQQFDIVRGEILNLKCNLLPGEIINLTNDFVDVSTYDFDIRLYFDKFEEIISQCKENNLVLNNKILKNLINIDDRTYSLQTLLMIAVKNRFYSMSKFLISSGADVNALDVFGNDVFHYANKIDSEEDKHKIMSLLICNEEIL